MAAPREGDLIRSLRPLVVLLVVAILAPLGCAPDDRDLPEPAPTPETAPAPEAGPVAVEVPRKLPLVLSGTGDDAARPAPLPASRPEVAALLKRYLLPVQDSYSIQWCTHLYHLL